MDTIADMLTKIRNAQASGKTEITVPFSKLKMAILRILEEESCVEKVETEKKENSAFLRVALKYRGEGTNKRIPIIASVERISRPGRRVYVGKKEIKPVKKNLGIVVISTPRGVMTGNEAKKIGVGGELICGITLN